MDAGDIYWAEVPFKDAPGAKVRPVLVLHAPAEQDVVVLRGTTKLKPKYELIAAIDFDLPRYDKIRIKGQTFFYLVGLSTLPREKFRELAGRLPDAEFNAIVSKLNRKRD